MTKQPYSAVLAALVATLSSVSIEGASAKQQCTASSPANSHGYWSWRLIDGRKCWYEGKPMLSKSSLEWAAQPPTQSDVNEEPASTVTEESKNPMDSQARVIDDSETFDALWRARIGRH
jgi:hypothetical protein